MKTNHWQRLAKGLTFTELGMGTAPLGNLYKAISEDEANATLEKAWEVGCRYFDTAPLYGLGLAETRVNRFLKGKPRDEYVLSTKVGRLMEACAPEHRTGIGKFFETPTRREMFDYSYNGIMRSFETSLERLGVDRVDILLCHCEARNVGIVLGGPYNSGILASGARQGAFYNYDPAPPEIMERVKRIEAICERHGVKLIEAALRFPLHHPSVVTTIPGAQAVNEVESNKATLAADIPDALWADLKKDGLMREDAPTP